MPLLRSDRFPAILLLFAAAAGLAVANSPLGPLVFAAMGVHLGIPGVIDLSVEHAIKDGLLAVFFFVVAVELRHELTRGSLRSVRAALQPAIAATGGVLVPIGVYLAIAGGSPSAAGWPVPTATDIAFALGVLAVFGRGLPAALRVFLLALAVLDDIIGILFITVLFTRGVDLVLLALAAVGVAVFGILSRGVGGARHPIRVALLIVVAVVTWWLVARSGVHATIAGVALGLAMAPRPAERAAHRLQPAVNGVVLPLFAFSAALVVIPAVPLVGLEPAFWGVVVALPAGKIVGITLFGLVAQRVGRGRGSAPGAPMPLGDLVAAGALGGIGFTVSLLLAELAFAGDGALRDQAVLGVLAGSVISLVLAGALVSWRARGYRRNVRIEAV